MGYNWRVATAATKTQHSYKNRHFFFFLEKEENQMMSSLDFYDTHNNHFIENTSVTEPRDTMSCWQHAAS